jgi:hypothetical protein
VNISTSTGRAPPPANAMPSRIYSSCQIPSSRRICWDMPWPTSLWNRCLQCCADYLRAGLAAGPIPPGAARRHRDLPCVEVSILPCRWAGPISGGFLLLCLAHGWQLQRHGALLPAAGVVLGGAAVAWGLWRLREGGSAPCRLQLHDGGRVVLLAGNRTEEAWIRPCSLWFGSHFVLVLRRPGIGSLRLLLGPGILSAQDHAALSRWLRRAHGGQGTGAGLLG